MRLTVARKARYAPTAQFLKFVENGAASYTGEVEIPAGGVLSNIVVIAEAVWDDGTSAAMKVGDADDDDGFFASTNLKATDLTAGQSISMESTQTRGGKAGDYLTVGSSTHIAPRLYPDGGVIKVAIAAGDADGSAGRTTVIVEYWAPEPFVNVKTIDG